MSLGIKNETTADSRYLFARCVKDKCIAAGYLFRAQRAKQTKFRRKSFAAS